MGRYEEKYDYSFFKNWKCIPRLSDGCPNQQINAFSDLDYELVYVRDMNYNLLTKINKQLHERNPKFKGFIMQTTSSQLLKIPNSFLTNAGVKFIEIDMESFNDKILKSHNKPNNEASILMATEKIRKLPIEAIANVMIGLNGEDYKTYGRTIKYIQNNVNIFSHLNIYEDKSFIQNESNQWFHNEIFNLGLHMLDSF